MHELYEGIELNEKQTELICRGLLDLARVDGVHPTELELVREFYAQGGGNPAGFDALSAQGFDLARVAPAIKVGGPKVVEAFLVSCYLLIYADGDHSEAERARVGAFADALGVSRDQLEELHVKARLFLLTELAQSLRTKDAVKQVGHGLGLDSDQIARVWETLR